MPFSIFEQKRHADMAALCRRGSHRHGRCAITTVDRHLVALWKGHHVLVRMNMVPADGSESAGTRL